MKTMNLLATCMALVALTGCNPNSSTTDEKPAQPQASTGAVIELPKDNPVATLDKNLSAPVPPPAVAAAEKTGFITSAEQKLKEFDTKIDELAKKSEGYKDDAKTQAEQALATLREQRAKLNEQFDNLKKSSAEALKELKTGFEAAFSELEKAYENAKSKFS
jgi:hypothetical protein